MSKDATQTAGDCASAEKDGGNGIIAGGIVAAAIGGAILHGPYGIPSATIAFGVISVGFGSAFD